MKKLKVRTFVTKRSTLIWVIKSTKAFDFDRVFSIIEIE